MDPFPPMVVGLLALVSLVSAPAVGAQVERQVEGQIEDPLPPVPFGGLSLETEIYVVIPPSADEAPLARLSLVRTLEDGRQFVSDLRGLIHSFDRGTSSVYLDIRPAHPDFVDSPGFGTGLYSFAFHPEFAQNGRLYTAHAEGREAEGAPDFVPPDIAPDLGYHAVLTEWTATDPSASTFEGTSREVMRIRTSGTVRAIQEIAFNPNARPGEADYGLLYVPVGEGDGNLARVADGLNRLDSPLGTIMRIDPQGTNAANGRYGIPADNPWADSGEPGVLGEIWAYGFRNPNRIGWSPGPDSFMYVGDIGEGNVEEINLVEPGRNYGWPEREGTFRLDPTDPELFRTVFALDGGGEGDGYTYPIAQYDHDEGDSVAAGPVYQGSIPELGGLLFFSDVRRGRVFYIRADDARQGAQADVYEAHLYLDGTNRTLAEREGRADLRWGVDRDAELLVLTQSDGTIRRIVGVRVE